MNQLYLLLSTSKVNISGDAHHGCLSSSPPFACHSDFCLLLLSCGDGGVWCSSRWRAIMHKGWICKRELTCPPDKIKYAVHSALLLKSSQKENEVPSGRLLHQQQMLTAGCCKWHFRAWTLLSGGTLPPFSHRPTKGIRVLSQVWH